MKKIKVFNSFIRKFSTGLSIQKRLLFFFMVVIMIPVLIIGGFSYAKSSAIVIDKIRHTESWATYQVTSNLDTILSSYKDIAVSICQDQMAQRYIQKKTVGAYSKKQFQEMLMGKIIQDIHSIFIFSRDGTVYGYDTQLLDANIDYKKLDEYKQYTKNKKEINWFPTRQIKFFSPTTREIPEISTAFSVAAVLKDFDSLSEIGFLIINFKEENLREICEKVMPFENSYNFIIDQNGIIISHNDKTLLGKKLQSDYTDTLIKNNEGNFYANIDGIDSLIIYNTCTTTGWKFVNIIPVQSITKEVEGIKSFSLAIIALSCLFAISMAIIFSKSISNPIMEMMQAMKQVENGDLSIRITPKYNDEIGRLGESFNVMIERINYLIKKNYQNELMKRESEYKALRAQINPHFLYNTLESINWIARKHKVDDISNMVISLGDLMRASIRTDNDIVTVSEELKYIEEYLTIQQIRYRDKFTVHMDIDEGLLNNKMPKFTIQPIIENAIVHGIEKKIGKGELRISARQENNTMVFIVEDDGMGMPEEKAKELLENTYDNQQLNNILSENDANNNEKKSQTTRLGLTNVNRRIKMLYGDQYGIQLSSRLGEGTQVIILLPAKVNLESIPKV